MLQEDKILQNNLVLKNERIVYAWDADVYDEKVVSGEQVETQRSRWLFSYFQNLPNSSKILLKGIFNFSFNQFLFGLVTIAPPMFIQLFAAIFLAIIGWWISPMVSLALVLAIAIFAGNVLLTLYLSKAPSEIWKALWGIPFFVLKQATALLKIGNPNKNFKHTEHTRNYSLDEVIKKDKS